MKPKHFDPESDLPPMPFDDRICRLALEIKNLGLAWRPHVGCFVWDPEHHIKPDSPFPKRIYFILSLPRFIDLLGSEAAVAEKMVWLPTWHQARLVCELLGIDESDFLISRNEGAGVTPSEELANVYSAIIRALQNRRSDDARS